MRSDAGVRGVRGEVKQPPGENRVHVEIWGSEAVTGQQGNRVISDAHSLCQGQKEEPGMSKWAEGRCAV